MLWRKVANPTVAVEALSGRRDLTENLPLRNEPIIERRSILVSLLTVELIGPFCDQGLEVIAAGGRQRMRVLRRRFFGLLLFGGRGFPFRFCRASFDRFHVWLFLLVRQSGMPCSSRPSSNAWTIKGGHEKHRSWQPVALTEVPPQHSYGLHETFTGCSKRPSS